MARGKPIQARQTPAWERGIKWARRRPATAALLAVSAFAALLLLVGLFISNASIRAEQALTKQALIREQNEAARSYLAIRPHKISSPAWP